MVMLCLDENQFSKLEPKILPRVRMGTCAA